jgi:putative Mn2+ efflux pump MntP
MTTWEILMLSLALSTDAFSIGAAVGLHHRKPRQIFRLSWHFGVFQSLMFLGGAMAGTVFLSAIDTWDHWVAFAILSFLGIKMIGTVFQKDKEARYSEVDLTRGLQMVGLSVAVSIDALGVGIGMAALETPLTFPTISIGVVASLATLAAMLLGQKVHRWLGHWCEPVAGFVLIGLGTKILLQGLAR